ncbi:MAG: hypothetical protein K2M91_13720, partial [Lachnospiraceae bacterium]|nr:hypothetical protein [Lachnospiraceae bacterium]
LYTIWENGEIGLIGKDIPNCSPADFSVAFESGSGKTFYGSMWDNSIGEMKQITYEWNEERKMFLEKN